MWGIAGNSAELGHAEFRVAAGKTAILTPNGALAANLSQGRRDPDANLRWTRNLSQVRHLSHPYYLMAPGGQVSRSRRRADYAVIRTATTTAT